MLKNPLKPASGPAGSSSDVAPDALQAWRERIAAAQSDDDALLRLAHQMPGVELKLAAIEALTHEDSFRRAMREFGDQDKRLAQAAYLADEYSIADIATFPWVARHEWHRVDLAQFPAVKRWHDAIAQRPAVVRGMAVPFLN